MKLNKLALSLLVGIGTGCTTAPPAPPVSMSDLPNCFDTNYDKASNLFTMKNAADDAVNQQCLLTVGARRGVASASRLMPGRYRVSLSNGGGGGGGGTVQAEAGRGGAQGGGGGAGAKETQATVNLTGGIYKLTIGAGGPGGTACHPGAGFGGGPGWLGSPSNMIRVSTGEVVIGAPGADKYARPTRSQNEEMAGKMDGHGGTGPGQTSGGQGGRPETNVRPEVEADPGVSHLATGRSGVGGGSGPVLEGDSSSGAGGGGGATRVGHGGGGGGESAGQKDIAPERGSLGSGGGGGQGSSSECDPGARGGHGYISLRPI